MGKARGELAELRESLDGLAKGTASKSVASKKEVIKKVIGYMTVGIDMSTLFMPVMTCAVSSSDDVALKKMLYLYIGTYAQQNPELTLLTINLLTKDCRDQDPTIRGLALRSLCSLRVQNLTEYLVQPIRMGLKDPHHYVRRTAVMGVLKVFHLDQNAVRNAGFLDDLKEMLTNDPDAQVVANCLSVLQQAGIAKNLVSRNLVIPLLNRIKEFSEWAQCQVLEFAAGYEAKDEQEVYNMMNVLDDRLSHSNTAVVMATIKLFLHLTLRLPATHQLVLERIKDPLQTMISRDRFETAYAVLTNFLIIVQRAPLIFSQIYSSFYCRQNEPSYIKMVKLEILSAIADESNAYEIATELTEYVNDIDVPLGKAAVRAVGRIALEVQDASGIVERLLGFLEVGKAHITAEALIQIKDLLRRYPDIAEACLSSISATSMEEVTDPAGKAAFVWILGQYGQGIQDAPYLLEPVAKNFVNEDIQVRLATLTAVTKLFLKRPPECHLMLGTCLQSGLADPNQAIHDRALLYYRALRYSTDDTKQLVNREAPSILSFSEDQSAEIRDKIFDEFNTLAVVYRQPAYAFVQQADVTELHDTLGPDSPTGQQVLADEGDSLLPDETPTEASGVEQASPQNGSAQHGDLLQPAHPPTGNRGDPMGDLLGGGADLLGGLEEFSIGPSSPSPPSGLQLSSQANLTPAEFQTKWATWETHLSLDLQLSSHAASLLQPNSLSGFTQMFQRENIVTMASGGRPAKFVFFFYAWDTPSNVWFLINLTASSLQKSGQLVVKSDKRVAGVSEQFESLVRSLVS